MIIEKMALWTNFNFDIYNYSVYVKPHPPGLENSKGHSALS